VYNSWTRLTADTDAPGILRGRPRRFSADAAKDASRTERKRRPFRIARGFTIYKLAAARSWPEHFEEKVNHSRYFMSPLFRYRFTVDRKVGSPES